jgi:FkbM family methyltransferase
VTKVFSTNENDWVDMKQVFSFGGMNIAVRFMHLTPKIEQALSSGCYENAERTAIGLHVTPKDRVLDLGGGIGCTGIVAGKIVGGENLMIVEANADLGCEIMENLAANGVTGSQLIQTAVVAHETTGHVGFYKSKAFWAGSLCKNNAKNSCKINVPAMSLLKLVTGFKPTVIICDTEGIEIEFFKFHLPDHVRLIIMELHPNCYNQKAIKTLFDDLSDMGFSYVPHGSRGAVICMGK